jgi:hypothetical protein
MNGLVLTLVPQTLYERVKENLMDNRTLLVLGILITLITVSVFVTSDDIYALSMYIFDVFLGLYKS